jgi:hypothetical protein
MYTLSADYSIDCGDPLLVGEYPGSPAYVTAHWQAILFIFVWIIGIPLYIGVAVFKKRKHLYDTSSPRHHETVIEYGSLFLQ